MDLNKIVVRLTLKVCVVIQMRYLLKAVLVKSQARLVALLRICQLRMTIRGKKNDLQILLMLVSHLSVKGVFL